MKIGYLIVLLLILSYMWTTLERRTLYFPDPLLAVTPAVYRLPYEDLSLTAGDGTPLHGWLIPQAGPARRRALRPAGGSGRAGVTVLFCHGNAGNISHRLEKALQLHRIGLEILLFDYRGYGKSAGKPSETGTYRDAEAAYDYLVRTRKVPPGRIVLYGESLGCAVAAEIALHHPARALILESPFTSTAAMGRLVFPWLPVRWIVRDKYDTLSKIPSVITPLLILHSPQDEIVPFQMGQQLFAAARGRKQFYALTGGHNDGWEASGAGYLQAIQSFLAAQG